MGGNPGGYALKSWVVMCNRLPKPHTLFKTEICDFPFDIYDPTKNSIPYFRPDPKSIFYLRNGKLQGNSYNKRCQRRIYKRSNQPKKKKQEDGRLQG